MSVLRHCQLWTGEEPEALPDDIHTYPIKLDLFAQQPYLSRSFGQWKDTGNFEDIFRRMHLCQLYDFFSRNCEHVSSAYFNIDKDKVFFHLHFVCPAFSEEQLYNNNLRKRKDDEDIESAIGHLMRYQGRHATPPWGQLAACGFSSYSSNWHLLIPGLNRTDYKTYLFRERCNSIVQPFQKTQYRTGTPIINTCGLTCLGRLCEFEIPERPFDEDMDRYLSTSDGGVWTAVARVKSAGIKRWQSVAGILSLGYPDMPFVLPPFQPFQCYSNLKEYIYSAAHEADVTTYPDCFVLAYLYSSGTIPGRKTPPAHLIILGPPGLGKSYKVQCAMKSLYPCFVSSHARKSALSMFNTVGDKSDYKCQYFDEVPGAFQARATDPACALAKQELTQIDVSIETYGRATRTISVYHRPWIVCGNPEDTARAEDAVLHRFTVYNMMTGTLQHDDFGSLQTNLAQLHLYAWTLGVIISCNLLDYPEMPDSPNDSWSARKLARFHSLYYGIRLLDHVMRTGGTLETMVDAWTAEPSAECAELAQWAVDVDSSSMEQLRSTILLGVDAEALQGNLWTPFTTLSRERFQNDYSIPASMVSAAIQLGLVKWDNVERRQCRDAGQTQEGLVKSAWVQADAVEKPADVMASAVAKFMSQQYTRTTDYRQATNIQSIITDISSATNVELRTCEAERLLVALGYRVGKVAVRNGPQIKKGVWVTRLAAPAPPISSPTSDDDDYFNDIF